MDRGHAVMTKLGEPFAMPTGSRARRLPALLILGLASITQAHGSEPEGDRFFLERIRPVLEASCFSCHSEASTKIKGGLRIDSREAILRGGDSGPAAVPGKGADSLLIQAIRQK